MCWSMVVTKGIQRRDKPSILNFSSPLLPLDGHSWGLPYLVRGIKPSFVHCLKILVWRDVYLARRRTFESLRKPRLRQPITSTGWYSGEVVGLRFVDVEKGWQPPPGDIAPRGPPFTLSFPPPPFLCAIPYSSPYCISLHSWDMRSLFKYSLVYIARAPHCSDGSRSLWISALAQGRKLCRQLRHKAIKIHARVYLLGELIFVSFSRRTRLDWMCIVIACVELQMYSNHR